MAGTGITSAQIPGLIADTLAHYKDTPKIKMALEYQRYFFIDEVFKQDTYDVQDGHSVEYRFITDDNGQARHANFLEGRTINLRDNTLIGSAPWTLADNVAVWSRHQIEMNKGKARILDTLKKAYAKCFAELFRILEGRAVLSPDSAADSRNPPGLQFWFSGLPTGTTNYTGGFLGTTTRYGDNTTTTTVGGLNKLANPKARNWVANHNGMTMQTLDTMRMGMIYTNFVTPTTLKQFYEPRNRKLKILTSLAYMAEYERLVNQIGPDGRNKDLNPFHGNAMTFRGVEWVGLPTLENVALNPIYVCDFMNFRPIVHSNFWLKEDEVMRDREQPHLYSMQVDCWYSYVMDLPRNAGFSLHAPW